MEYRKQDMNSHSVTEALVEILEQYPRIRLQSVEAFAPVYYPIAMVEMQLQEHTFEDFETVQLAVLRLMALGITQPRLIAMTLGLSAAYVEKVIHLLTGFGHLQGTALTPLGLESVKQQKKILLNETSQVFQVDALNGTLLKLPQTVTDKAVAQQEQTPNRIGHLSCLEGISEEVLREQLAGDRGMEYIYHNADILHANVSGIRDVRCTGICYAQSYLMKLEGQTVPVLFAKRYDKTKKALRDRFSWQPYSVANPQVAQQCGFHPDTPVSTAPANESILQMHQILADARARADMTESIRKTLEDAYGLGGSGLTLRSRGEQVVVSVEDNAVLRVKKSLLALLRNAGAKPEQPLTSGYQYGLLLCLRIVGPKLRLLGQLLENVEPEDRKAMDRGLFEQFKDYRGEQPLADAMILAIREA